MNPLEMQAVMRQFREKFPNTPQGLNLREMQKILTGELVMVPKGKKFVLMTADELQRKIKKMRKK